MKKLVDGVLVDLTAEEIATKQAEETAIRPLSLIPHIHSATNESNSWNMNSNKTDAT